MLLARCAGTCLWSRGQSIASPDWPGTLSDPSPLGLLSSGMLVVKSKTLHTQTSILPLKYASKPATMVLTKITGDPPHGYDKYLTHR